MSIDLGSLRQIIDVTEVESRIPKGYGWLARSDETQGYFVHITPDNEMPGLRHGFSSPTYKAYGTTITEALEAALKQIPRNRLSMESYLSMIRNKKD